MTPDQNPSWINYKRMAKAALNQHNREFDAARKKAISDGWNKLDEECRLKMMRRKVHEITRKLNKIDARIQKRLDALDV